MITMAVARLPTVGLPPPAQAGGGSPKNPLYAGFFVKVNIVLVWGCFFA